MAMPWTDSSASSARPSQPTYLPPHLREYQDNSPISLRSGSSRGGRRRRGGGARGTGGSSPNQPRSRPRPGRNFSDQNGYENPPQSFGITEKFCELSVAEKDSSGEVNENGYDDTPVETSGHDVPPPVTSFSEIPFTKALSDNIKWCKYVKPTPIQCYAIPVAMSGRDVMACAQTGSGKTAAFCFPIISRILSDHLEMPGAAVSGLWEACPVGLILAPTRELSLQIHEELKKFSYQTGVKVAVAYGGASIAEQLRNLEKGVDILVATPGRLVDMIERSRVSLNNVKYLTLDEADRMLDMGFEPQIRKLVQNMGMPPPGARQSLLFSATFPKEIQKLASDFLSNYIFLAAGKVGSSTNLIIQKVEHVHDKDKRKHLIDLLRAQRATENQGKLALTLIFVETKRGADALQQWLSMKDFPSISIHGDKVQVERERALRSFKRGQTPILVATDVAARGLDIPHVAHVINFDLPRDIADYVHRIGRTGRAGKSGLATAFFTHRNLPLAKALVELMLEANQQVPTWLNEYATETSSYDTIYGSTRSSRHGGIKFSGHDYRRESESYNGSNVFADDANIVHNSYASTSRGTGFDYRRDAESYNNGPNLFGDNAGVSDPYASSSSTSSAYAYHNTSDSFVGDTYSHSSGAAVVATGWW